MLVCKLACVLAPVIPDGGMTVQVYWVPVGTTSGEVLTGLTVKALSVQIADVLSDIAGLGLTVTVVVKLLVHT